MGNQIEGYYRQGQNAIVIEDLISTGGSSLKAIDALRKANIHVKGLLATFTYGFDEAVKSFEKANCPFFTLTNYSYLIEKALQNNYIKNVDLDLLQSWHSDRKKWKIKT